MTASARFRLITADVVVVAKIVEVIVVAVEAIIVNAVEGVAVVAGTVVTGVIVGSAEGAVLAVVDVEHAREVERPESPFASPHTDPVNRSICRRRYRSFERLGAARDGEDKIWCLKIVGKSTNGEHAANSCDDVGSATAREDQAAGWLHCYGTT